MSLYPLLWHKITRQNEWFVVWSKNGKSCRLPVLLRKLSRTEKFVQMWQCAGFSRSGPCISLTGTVKVHFLGFFFASLCQPFDKFHCLQQVLRKFAKAKVGNGLQLCNIYRLAACTLNGLSKVAASLANSILSQACCIPICEYMYY